MISPRTTLENHFDWYPAAEIYDRSHVDEFLDGLDALLILEKLHDWGPAIKAQRRHIRLILMPMYEITPDPLPVNPDVFICPSRLDFDVYGPKGTAIYLPVPVDVPWRQRRSVRTFVHNAGNGYGFFRNGTFDLLAAVAFIKSPIQLIVRMQESLWRALEVRERREEIQGILDQAARDPRVVFVRGTVPYEELWTQGDAFVFPERYNGLSLPLQEARASGMLVIASDRYPMNTWLPREPLIPVSGYEPVARFGIEVRSAIVRPEDIARTIDEWYDADITAYSREGREWAQAHSWSRWRQTYLDVLAGRCDTRPDESSPGCRP